MKCRVIERHHSTYPDPIEFEEGDLLEVGLEDDEYPGWIWVKLQCGNQGWAPGVYIEMTDKLTMGTAKSNYSARELNVEIGDHLLVGKSLCEWSYVTNEHGETGWVPQKCLTSI